MYVPYFTGIRREFFRLARGVAPRPGRIIGRVAGHVTALWTHATRLMLERSIGFAPIRSAWRADMLAVKHQPRSETITLPVLRLVPGPPGLPE